LDLPRVPWLRARFRRRAVGLRNAWTNSLHPGAATNSSQRAGRQPRSLARMQAWTHGARRSTDTPWPAARKRGDGNDCIRRRASCSPCCRRHLVLLQGAYQARLDSKQHKSKW